MVGSVRPFNARPPAGEFHFNFTSSLCSSLTPLNSTGAHGLFGIAGGARGPDEALSDRSIRYLRSFRSAPSVINALLRQRIQILPSIIGSERVAEHRRTPAGIWDAEEREPSRVK